MGGSSRPAPVTNTTNTVAEPWSGQQGYLQSAFRMADAGANAMNAAGPYRGPRNAGSNIHHQQGLANWNNIAAPQQQAIADTALGAMNTQLGGMSAQDMESARFLGQNSSAGLLGLMNSEATQHGNVNFNPNQFTPQLNTGLLSGADPTGAINQMMSATPNMDVYNPVLEAAARAPTQNFLRNVLPGISDNAIANGQLGSNRQAIAEGLAMSDLNQQIGDRQAGILQQAASEALQQRTQGAGLASQLRQAGGQLSLGANELGGQLAGTQAGLIQNTQQLNEQARQANNQLRLGAAQQANETWRGMYGDTLTSVDRGLIAAPQVQQMMTAPGQTRLAVGDVYRGFQQDDINAAMAGHMDQSTFPFQTAQLYSDIVQGSNWGGMSSAISSQQQPQQSRAANALGGAALGFGMGGPLGAGVGLLGGLFL